MTRLFVAVDLSDELREAVARAVSALRERMRRAGFEPEKTLRWVTAANLHVTLHFIGHVPDDRADEIRAVLAPRFDEQPFLMSLGGLGAFPSTGPPRTVWVGVIEGADSLARVHRAVGARLARIAQPIESRPFHAHVTLARTRARTRHLSREQSAFPGSIGACPVDHVTLYRSQVSPGGSRYEPLLRTGLAERGS